MNKYTFIFEVACRDCFGKILPREYRKKTGMSIKDARVCAESLYRNSCACDLCMCAAGGFD